MMLELTINERPAALECEPDEMILGVLRREGLSSVRATCGIGVCGACTILLDGEPVSGCLLLAGQAAGRNLTTAEIGDLVRTTRKAAGLRQDELAGAAGVGLRFIVDLEAGKPTAQIGKTLQVLAALGCSLDITPPPEPKGARKA